QDHALGATGRGHPGPAFFDFTIPGKDRRILREGPTFRIPLRPARSLVLTELLEPDPINDPGDLKVSAIWTFPPPNCGAARVVGACEVPRGGGTAIWCRKVRYNGRRYGREYRSADRWAPEPAPSLFLPWYCWHSAPTQRRGSPRAASCRSLPR